MSETGTQLGRGGGLRFGQPLRSSDSSVVAHPFLFIERNADWQAIEIRANGTANSNVTSQMVWSAAYANAAILQDAYSGGVIQPNSRIYLLQDASWNTAVIVGLVSGNWQGVRRSAHRPGGGWNFCNYVYHVESQNRPARRGNVEKFDALDAPWAGISRSVSGPIRKYVVQIRELQRLKGVLAADLKLCRAGKPQRCVVVDQLQSAAKNNQCDSLMLLPS